MVSGREIKKREADTRAKRRQRVAEIGTVVLAIALNFAPKTPIILWLALAAMSLLLVYAAFQFPWIREANPAFTKCTRMAIGIVGAVGLVSIYGVMVWPAPHRHSLSKSERAKFENPLKDLKQPKMSIHLYCAPEDEVDCEYAADFIPLFGEAGWDIATTVDRVNLGRPRSGILIGLHGTVKPEDESKLKWNQGEWTRLTPEQFAVRQAFVNIGIEPDAMSGATVPENQINIFVGHEREDESAPTDMTREVEQLQRDASQHPEVDIKKLLGEK